MPVEDHSLVVESSSIKLFLVRERLLLLLNISSNCALIFSLPDIADVESVSTASSTHVKTHKLLQVCKQVVTSLFTSCQQVVFALLVLSLL